MREAVGDGAISEVKHDVMWVQINEVTDKINIYICTLGDVTDEALFLLHMR